MTLSKNFLLLLFFTFFAIALTAPLASSHYVPAGDFMDHAKAIVLAKNALFDEHQFPIRIAADLIDNPRYPLFQFYAPFPYMISGIIFKFISIKNPFIAYKILTWLALILGGIFTYRLANLLVNNNKIALLCGVAYQFSPYWIINTTIRTDFTESIAQGFLPIVLYYSFQVFLKFNLKRFIIAIAMWSILAMTHLITYAYALAFFSICIFFYSIYARKIKTTLLLLSGLIITQAVLSAWFLIPIISLHSLLNFSFGNPLEYNFLTPFANLLSLQSISPLPLPAKGELGVDYLYPAIGYPILLGIGIITYAFFTDKEFIKAHVFIRPILITFLMVFLAVWSPINIWGFIPKIFVIFQFTYRFLTHLNWIGIILFAYALKWVFKKEMDETAFIGLLCIIVIGNSAWLHTQKNNNLTYKEITKGYQEHLANEYRVNPSKIDSNKLLLNTLAPISCEQNTQNLECVMKNIVKDTNIVLPMLWYPNMIKVTMDNQPITYSPVLYKDKLFVGVQATEGDHTFKARFTGITWANTLSGFAWILIGATLVLSYFNKKKSYA